MPSRPIRSKASTRSSAYAPSRIRYAMLAGGLIVRRLRVRACSGTAPSIAYPLNSGGRPLNSWPVFLLVPFEVGVLAAALSGVVAFLWSCGLPRLHHPLFDVPGIERATQDRFFLLAAAETRDEAVGDLRRRP